MPAPLLRGLAGSTALGEAVRALRAAPSPVGLPMGWQAPRSAPHTRLHQLRLLADAPLTPLCAQGCEWARPSPGDRI